MSQKNKIKHFLLLLTVNVVYCEWNKSPSQTNKSPGLLNFYRPHLGPTPLEGKTTSYANERRESTIYVFVCCIKIFVLFAVLSELIYQQQQKKVGRTSCTLNQ